MTTLSTLFTLSTLSTLLALPLAATASPAPQPSPVGVKPTLPTLQAEMHRTGQVGVPDLHSDGKGILVAAPTAQRPETRVRSIVATSSSKTSKWALLRDDPTLDIQYGRAFTASVERCRFDVARREGVNPAEIAAGTVTLRWTIEPSGRVRDVFAVASSPTDEGVTDCAKRMVASRVLLNPVAKPLALELTYTFRKISASTDELAAREGLPSDR
jgi:hypothetical protein